MSKKTGTSAQATTPSSKTGRFVSVYVADKSTSQNRATAFISVKQIRRSAGLGKAATLAVRKRLAHLGIPKKKLK